MDRPSGVHSHPHHPSSLVPHPHPSSGPAPAHDAPGLDRHRHPCGRSSGRAGYHEPHARCLHSHPYHRDPEFDARCARGAVEGLWCVTAVSNPVRFKTRYALYKRFREHVTRDLRINLITVEAAFGDRDHQLTEDDLDAVVTSETLDNGVRTLDVRVRNKSQVWLKENLWNIGARQLPTECRYVLFCDADVEFVNPHFGTELVHALQEYKVVQPFETAADLGPEGQIMDVHRSFGWCHANGWDWKPRPDGKGGYGCKRPEHVNRCAGFGTPWHPGYAIAFRREVLDRLGGVLETGILGAGDHHECGALLGRAEMTFPAGIHPNYKRDVLAWQRRAMEHVNLDFGYVNGTILHYFHGAKTNRRYVSRWDILVKHQYDPDTDVYKNAQGVYELEDHKPALRDAIRAYFRQRNEDGLDM